MHRKKTGRAATQAKQATPRSQVRRYSLLFVLLALGLDLAFAYWGHQVWVDDEQQKRLAALSAEQAQATAAAVAVQLETYQQRLEDVVRNSDERMALSTGSETPSLLEQKVASAFPQHLSVHVIPAKATTASKRPQWPLSFAEFDMAARAESGEAVHPEATRDADQWQLSFVTKLPSGPGEPAAGSLLLALPISALTAALATDEGSLGRIELQQAFSDRSTATLLSVGAGDAGPVKVAKVPSSHFRVAFTPSARLLQRAEVNFAPLLAPLAAVIVISLIAALYLGRALGRARETTPGERATYADATGSGGDLLDLTVRDEDEALLGLAHAPEKEPADRGTERSPGVAPVSAETVPDVIFRAYDIRGRVDVEVTPQLAKFIGQSLGSEALDQGQKALIVARDARTHSPLLAQQLTEGILSTGCDVIDLGAVPTPLMYFATETLPQTQSGVMVTASHNPSEYNGFKVVMQGKSRSADDIQNVRRRILAGNFHTGRGHADALDIVPQYIETIISDVALAGDLHMVIDASNGIAGQVAPHLFRELGCQVTCIHCEPDGSFPNHAPDPSVSANLQDLVSKVAEVRADLGVAFDGDGDRMTVVSPTGQIIWADRLLLLLAKDIVARNPGADVVFDVKSTRLLNGAISSFGGRPIMWRTGHAPMRAKMMETGALLGGEYSGHIFIKDRWYGFDDGIYAAARLAEILTLRGESVDEALTEFPALCTTPEIRVAVAEDEKFVIVRQLIESGEFDGAKLTTLDGLRADFPEGWGLLRASNTSADLTLRFEAESDEDLDRIKQLFIRELRKLRPELPLNF